jgi:NADH:ubiquinone oxidoreductase subunit F (NADH-binding)
MDYETLTEIGSMMGSGGLIVMDEDTCMVDVAKYFLNFTVDESCGKCIPCRIGTKRAYEILDKITKGEAVIEDLKIFTRSFLSYKKYFFLWIRSSSKYSYFIYFKIF